MITILLIIAVGIMFLILWKKFKKPSNNVDKFVEIGDVPNIKPNIKSPAINPRFIEAQFHPDYMDVTTSFNNLSPNQRQIFNINNIPCKVTRDTDVSVVGEIVGDFITSINEDVKKNVPLRHTPNSGWDEVLPEYTEMSGWEKVQASLGLPTSLYNKPVMNTSVSLVRFSDIVKYETESEIKYVC